MKKKSSRVFLAVSMTAATLLLAGCIDLGGSGSSQTSLSDERSKLYETSSFTISVPREWEVIESKQFTSVVPGETVVVFRNNVKNETFTANVAVIRNTLQESLPTLEYAKMVLNRQSTGLFDYSESRRDERKIVVGGGETLTFLSDFRAKKGSEEMLVRYLQTYAVKDNAAYIVTGAFSPGENESTVKTIEDMVKSFKVK